MNCIESKILGCHAVSTFLLATKALQLSIYCCEDPLDSFHNLNNLLFLFFCRWYVRVAFSIYWDAGGWFLSQQANPYIYLRTHPNLYHWRLWSTLFLCQELIYFTWYALLCPFHPEKEDNCLVSFCLLFFYSPLYFSLASHHGVCSWSKCSYVHHP